MTRATMQWMFLIVLIPTAGLTSFPRFAVSQEAEPRDAAIEPGDIALIDMARVFKEHVAFNDALKQMKDEIEVFETEVRERKSAIEKRQADAQALLEGTEQRAAIEAEVLKATSDLQVDVQVKRKNLMNREGRLYAATYDDVTAEVKRYASKFGVRLVLRFNSEPINPEDRESVLKGVNREVVFQDELDISDIIIERLNGKTAAAD